MKYEHEHAGTNMHSGPAKGPPAIRRNKKDPDAPKRPMSAFLDYSKTFRSQVIMNNPDVKDNKEISKILGAMWRNALEAEKKPFVEKELRARAEHNEEMRLWKKARDEHAPQLHHQQQHHPGMEVVYSQSKKSKDDIRYDGMEDAIFSDSLKVPPLAKAKRVKKDPDAPKRPMSAFLDYSKTFRAQVIRNNPHVKDNKEISKILGILWRNAPEGEKKPFVDKELLAREEYNESMRQWKKEKEEQLAGETMHESTDHLMHYATSHQHHQHVDDGGADAAGQYASYYNAAQYGETYMS